MIFYQRKSKAKKKNVKITNTQLTLTMFMCAPKFPSYPAMKWAHVTSSGQWILNRSGTCHPWAKAVKRWCASSLFPCQSKLGSQWALNPHLFNRFTVTYSPDRWTMKPPSAESLVRKDSLFYTPDALSSSPGELDPFFIFISRLFVICMLS